MGRAVVGGQQHRVRRTSLARRLVGAALLSGALLAPGRVGAAPEPAPAAAAPTTYEAAPLSLARGETETYRLRVQPGATLWDIAVEALPQTVLEAGHERAVEMVTASFQQSNPGRGPGDVRLDDVFTLQVPAGTFVTASMAPTPGGGTEYTSFRGDKLTTFRRDPGVAYLYASADNPRQARVMLEPETSMAAPDLARHVYGNDPPDFLQVRSVRAALDQSPPVVTVDLQRPHLDQFRNYRDRAVATEQREDGLTLYRFDPADAEVPFLAVEDAIGDEWDAAKFPRLARREFYRDGTVRQYLITQPGDVLTSMVAPERKEWASLLGTDMSWYDGAPERLEPFAPAVNDLGSVLPGRLLVLAYRPKPAGAELGKGLQCLGMPVALALSGGLLRGWWRRRRAG